jgi:heat shock protein HslJ
LGDRVKIKSLTIQNGEVVVDMLTQGPNDPMVNPTQEVVETYKLQGNKLVPTSSKPVGGSTGQQGGTGQTGGGTQTGSATEPQLVGPAWQWVETQYSNDTNQTVPDPSKYTIQFKPDGTVSLQVDCNRGGGTYTATNESLAIQAFIMGRMGCGPDSLSEKFIRELNNAGTYVMRNGNLFINQRMDVGNMVFAPSVPATVQ